MSVIVDGTTISLTGTVGDIYWDEPSFSAAEVSLALAQVGHERDVVVRINSDGGYASEGAAIHATLARHGGKVTTVVEGVAASAASLVVMAGEERVMAPGSILMIHDPATCTCGTAADHEVSVRYLTALATSFAGIYAAASGKTAEEARTDMQAEVWFSPEEAVAAGYASRVGNDPEAGEGAEIIEFPERGPSSASITMMRHSPEIFRNAPEPLKALAVATGRSPRPSQAATAAAPKRQETLMTTTPPGGADTAPKPATAENQPATEKPDAAAQARTAALAYANGVLELCQIAGEPSKAKAFIEKETPLDEVRKSLADARATASAETGEVQSQQKPARGGRFNLATNMRARFGLKEA